jgi:hypothetical protein
MSRRDHELPPELAAMIERRRQLSRPPEAAKARLHRRLMWAFSPALDGDVLRSSPRLAAQRTPASQGLFRRLLTLRLAALPTVLLSHLPLAAAGLGVGAIGVASLSVVRVMADRTEPSARTRATLHRASHDRPGDRVDLALRALPAIPPLAPLPESLPAPEPVIEEPVPAPQRIELPPVAPGLIPAPAPGVSLAPAQPVPNPATHEPAEGPNSAQNQGPSLERQLLETARAELRSGAIAGALAKLDQHRALYPESQLSEEREVLVIEAKVRSGDPGAQSMVAIFRQRFPRSPLLPALEAFLKANPSPTSPQGVP